MVHRVNSKIVVAQEKDFPTIRNLAQAIWPPTFCEILSPSQIDYMMEMMYSKESLNQQVEKNNVFILFYHEEKPAGYLAYELNYLGRPTLRVHKIYLLTELHGHGLGKYLMDYAKNIASEKGMTKLSLNVNRYNKSVDFYLKYGFLITREEDIDIGNGFFMNDYVMEYNI